MLANPNTNDLSETPASGAATANKFYLATWRWHFYAGLYVVPFILMLALTGLVILFQPQLEDFQYRDRIFVAPQSKVLPASTQLEAARKAYPDASITRFRPNTAANRSSQVALKTKDERELNVYVNPYTAAVLGEVNNADRWGAIASNIHGSFWLGDLGDRLIEIAAGFGIILVVTGLYLWWPRNAQGLYGTFIPRFNMGKRTMWRDLHTVPGFYISIALLFFFVSGMAWTGIWGEKFVQAWNTFPAALWNEVPKSDANKTVAASPAEPHDMATMNDPKTMGDMNRPGEKVVPWNLEQSMMPASGSMAGKPGIPAGVGVNLNTVTQYARENGFGDGFWVALPADKTGVWTLSASTMSGDTKDARKDLTIHMDQYSGKVLATVAWKDYSLGAKAMAAGIALHQGNYGWWNQLLGAISCLMVLLMTASGLAMWWIRRPKGAFRLAAPPMPANLPMWKGAVVLMLGLSLAFPLVGLTLLGVLAFDWLVLSRIKPLKAIFS